MSNLPPPSDPPLDRPPPRTPRWRRWWVPAAALLVVVVVGGALSRPPDDRLAIEGAVPTDDPSPTPSATVSSSPSTSATPTTTPTAAASPGPTRRPTPTADPVARTRGGTARVVLAGTVVDVVDGDTIDLSDGTRVRLAIVDTPEVHGGRERCGPEASAFTARHVQGEVVTIVRPAGAPRTDAYGRTLGEVIRRHDGWSLNIGLMRQGLGTIDERYTSEDPGLATRARQARAEAASPDCASVTPPVPPPPAPDQAGAQDCAPGYDPCIPPYPPDLDCADVGRQVTITGSDPHGLDGDDADGRGCESY